MSARIHINRIGRTGNNLLQYIAANELSHRTGLDIIGPAPVPLNPIGKPLEKIDSDHVVVTDDTCGEMYSLQGDKSILIDASCHDSRLFDSMEIRARAKELINPPDEIIEDECAICIRLGDFYSYRGGVVLYQEYYSKAIEYMLEAGVRKFVIYADQYSKSYLEGIKIPQSANVSMPSPRPFSRPKDEHRIESEVDFNEIRKHKHVILSNSSFHWCAAYLGNASSLTFPNQWRGEEDPYPLSMTTTAFGDAWNIKIHGGYNGLYSFVRHVNWHRMSLGYPSLKSIDSVLREMNNRNIHWFYSPDDKFTPRLEMGIPINRMSILTCECMVFAASPYVDLSKINDKIKYLLVHGFSVKDPLYNSSWWSNTWLDLKKWSLVFSGNDMALLERW